MIPLSRGTHQVLPHRDCQACSKIYEIENCQAESELRFQVLLCREFRTPKDLSADSLGLMALAKLIDERSTPAGKGDYG